MKINKCVACDTYLVAMLYRYYDERMPDIAPQFQVVCLAKDCVLNSKCYDSEIEAINGWNNIDKFEGDYDKNKVTSEESQDYIDVINKLIALSTKEYADEVN